jgi:hypothetical protein
MLSLVDNSKTDKNTCHSYLPLYEKLLSSKKDSATHILEIGVQRGGSIKLWHDYFENAIVYGADIDDVRNLVQLQHGRIKILVGDAYNLDFANQFTDKFDMILDDGPHTLESMKSMIRLYLPKLKADGILIIEDVPNTDWLEELRNEVPMKDKVVTYDLRSNKNRFDDIVFTVQLNITQPKKCLAAICTFNPKEANLIKTIEGLTKFYPTFDIVIIDSDSTELEIFDKVPNTCKIHFCKNKARELGAWKFVHDNYPDYDVYMCIQDSLIPTSRIKNLDLENVQDKFYSFHYTCKLKDGGYFDVLQKVYKDSDLDFISKFTGEEVVIGTAHSSFLTDKKNLKKFLKLNNVYEEKKIERNVVHGWLNERTGGLVIDCQRIDIWAYFNKLHFNRH